VHGVVAALARRGYPLRDDQNGPWEDGVFAGVIAVSEAGERIPTSICYLDAAARARPNLTVHTDALVERVRFDGRRATGAEIRLADGTLMAPRARHVIVCAGAIHSPALLMRSGIGPADDLARLGIEVIAARAGVGGNLMEHPSIAVSAFLPRTMRTPFPDEHHEQAIVRYSSGLSGTPAGDMHGAILSRSGWHSVGYRLGTMFFWVNKSYSLFRCCRIPSIWSGSKAQCGSERQRLQTPCSPHGSVRALPRAIRRASQRSRDPADGMPCSVAH
jgi:5-(hydroxymethyl)furfural/furfural oxidase